MGVSGNSVAGKSYQIFTVSEELLAKVVEAVQAGEKEARSSGIQSLEVFCHGFRQNISLGRIYIVPPSVCSDRKDFPTALLHGALVRVFGTGGEEISDLIEKKIGDSEFDEYSQADFDSLKKSLFENPRDGKEACLVIFAPNWMSTREYIAFHFTKDSEELKNNLRHQVFSAYFDPRVSSAFNAMMTNVNTSKVDVTDITPKINFPFLAENLLKQYPQLEKQAGVRKPTILLNYKTADAVTKETLDPQELNVFDSLNQALENSLLPAADGAQGEGGFTAPSDGAAVPRAAAQKTAHGYIAFYGGKRVEIQAPTLWDAKKQAIAMLRVPKSKEGLLAVELAEKDGEQVTTTITSSVKKVAYVSHCPGHKNSKGEAAPWCIKDHSDDHIINSFKTKGLAESGLRNMESHKGSAEKEACAPHETPFTNVGPGTEAHAEQEKSAPAMKESVQDDEGKEDELTGSPIGIPIDEAGVPRREEAKEPKKAAWQGKYDQSGLFKQLDPAEEKKFRDYAMTNDPPDMAKWDIYHPVCRQVWEERGITPHDNQQQSLGVTSSKKAKNQPTNVHDPKHPETLRVGQERLSSAYSAAYNGGFVDKHSMPPQEVREYIQKTTSNDGYSPSSVADHAKQIDAGAFGDTPLSRRAQEKWGSAKTAADPRRHDQPIKEGDTVRYAVNFLRSISQYAGPMANAKGTVVGLQPFSEGRNLVQIDWHGEDLPGKVLDANLTVAGSPKERFESMGSVKGSAAEIVAHEIAAASDEPSEAMSHRAKQARAKKESLLDKFRSKEAVSLDIDSIWDEITEDMGPAPLVDVDADPSNSAPSNTDNREGFELSTPEGEGESEERPSTRPNKRDVGDLPEAFRSTEPEDEKAMSDSEADAQEDSMPSRREAERMACG